MKLHNNNELFTSIINAINIEKNIDLALIEKDYFITLFLKNLVNKMSHIIFKGGTSLSKCYKIIHRFSEDVDLTLDRNFSTQGTKKSMKKNIVETCNSLNYKILNKEEIRSRRDYNCYIIEYSQQHFANILKPYILVETTYITESFPTEEKEVSSIIYDYLKETNNFQIINEYELEPFKMNVQTLERTLVDKVFAICDYMISNKTERLSRHIYDIYQLLGKIKLDDDLKPLINEVRNLRKSHTNCYSSKDGVKINELLHQIIDTDYYKEDYINVTEKLLSKNIKYEEVILGLQQIIESKVFE